MISHRHVSPESTLRRLVGSLLLVVAFVVVAGCSKEPETKRQVAVAPPPPPPAPVTPPKPKVTPIADLMEELRIDERVVLPEENAPDNNEDRIAVLTFFDAFVRGDQETLGSLLTVADKVELDAMVDAGVWESAVEGIEEVSIETGPGPYAEACALAIFDVGGDFQPQLWYYKAEGNEHTFEAVATPPNIMDQLFGDDWIARWHEILAEEIALANKPDIEIDFKQVDLQDESEASPATGGGGGPSFGPGGGRRRPTGPPRRPPGLR